MNGKAPAKVPAGQLVTDIQLEARRHFPAKQKMRIVLECLRSCDSFARLCGKEGMPQSPYYNWPKDLLLLMLSISAMDWNSPRYS